MDSSIQKIPAEFTSETEMFEDSIRLGDALDAFFKWGRDRGITRENGATVRGQVIKFIEELNEMVEAWERGDISGATDGLGDALVVLVQCSRLMGISLDDAYTKAWDDIKDRKGQLCHGIFVKQADIDAFAKRGISLGQVTSVENLKELLNSREN